MTDQKLEVQNPGKHDRSNTIPY